MLAVRYHGLMYFFLRHEVEIIPNCEFNQMHRIQNI